jgi:hypothetical protein
VASAAGEEAVVALVEAHLGSQVSLAEVREAF